MILLLEPGGLQSITIRPKTGSKSQNPLGAGGTGIFCGDCEEGCIFQCQRKERKREPQSTSMYFWIARLSLVGPAACKNRVRLLWGLPGRPHQLPSLSSLQHPALCHFQNDTDGGTQKYTQIHFLRWGRQRFWREYGLGRLYHTYYASLNNKKAPAYSSCGYFSILQVFVR